MPSRRQFLASLAATSIAPHAVTAAAADTPRTPIKVGFLGTGYSHFADKYRLIRESADFELVGLCDDSADVRALGPAGARWMSRPELLASVEVVVVESEPQHHASDAKEALLARRHVHLEKPPADSLPAFRELLELAQTHQRVLQIGYMWRYNPGVRAAIEAAQKGWLGDIFLVRATMNTTLAGPRRPDWARFRGGAMFEQGSHLVDMVVRLLGRPQKVTPFLKTSGPYNDQLADNTLAVFEYPRAWAIVTSAPLQPNAGPHRFLEILGTSGSARVQPLEPPGLHLDLKSAAGPYAAGSQVVPLPAYHRYVDEFRDLATTVRGGAALPVTAAVELDIQEALMRACDML
jgi:predicted dehydrogenase